MMIDSGVHEIIQSQVKIRTQAKNVKREIITMGIMGKVQKMSIQFQRTESTYNKNWSVSRFFAWLWLCSSCSCWEFDCCLSHCGIRYRICFLDIQLLKLRQLSNAPPDEEDHDLDNEIGGKY